MSPQFLGQLTGENAGYEWIKGVLENRLALMKSDTIMAELIEIIGKGIDKDWRKTQPIPTFCPITVTTALKYGLNC